MRPGKPLSGYLPFLQWTAGESNPDCLGANQASSRWTSGPCIQEVRSGIEPDLPPYRGGVLPEHLPAVLRNDPGWTRTIGLLAVDQASSPLDHGIASDRGGSRTHRHEALDLAAMPVCVPGRKWRVRELHPAVQAYETRLSLRPPAVAGPGIEPGAPALWEPVGHLPRLQCCQ